MNSTHVHMYREGNDKMDTDTHYDDPVGAADVVVVVAAAEAVAAAVSAGTCAAGRWWPVTGVRKPRWRNRSTTSTRRREMLARRSASSSSLALPPVLSLIHARLQSKSREQGCEGEGLGLGIRGRSQRT